MSMTLEEQPEFSPWALSRGEWPLQAVASVELRLAGGAEAISRARHGVLDGLGDALGDEERTDLELLISELVTNAVRHGGMTRPEDAITVHAAAAPSRLRVEVCDGGPGFEARPPRPKSFDEGGGGLGLVLLDRLAVAWGVARGENTCVWAEFAR